MMHCSGQKLKNWAQGSNSIEVFPTFWLLFIVRVEHLQIAPENIGCPSFDIILSLNAVLRHNTSAELCKYPTSMKYFLLRKSYMTVLPKGSIVARWLFLTNMQQKFMFTLEGPLHTRCFFAWVLGFWGHFLLLTLV